MMLKVNTTIQFIMAFILSGFGTGASITDCVNLSQCALRCKFHSGCQYFKFDHGTCTHNIDRYNSKDSMYKLYAIKGSPITVRDENVYFLDVEFSFLFSSGEANTYTMVISGIITKNMKIHINYECIETCKTFFCRKNTCTTRKVFAMTKLHQNGTNTTMEYNGASKMKNNFNLNDDVIKIEYIHTVNSVFNISVTQEKSSRKYEENFVKCSKYCLSAVGCYSFKMVNQTDFCWLYKKSEANLNGMVFQPYRNGINGCGVFYTTVPTVPVTASNNCSLAIAVPNGQSSTILRWNSSFTRPECSLKPLHISTKGNTVNFKGIIFIHMVASDPDVGKYNMSLSSMSNVHSGVSLLHNDVLNLNIHCGDIGKSSTNDTRETSQTVAAVSSSEQISPSTASAKHSSMVHSPITVYKVSTGYVGTSSATTTTNTSVAATTITTRSTTTTTSQIVLSNSKTIIVGTSDFTTRSKTHSNVTSGYNTVLGTNPSTTTPNATTKPSRSSSKTTPDRTITDFQKTKITNCLKTSNSTNGLSTANHGTTEKTSVTGNKISGVLVTATKTTTGMTYHVTSDTTTGHETSDTTTGHETADTTTGHETADTTTGHETADTTTGHETADTTTGHEKADTTTGHETADKTTGHETADTTTGRAADTTTSHETADTTTSHEKADTTTGHETADKTTGHETADTTTGHEKADTTTGHETADKTTGHETADTTTGRAADTTTSHETADTTTGHETADTTTGHETADTTTGHEKADKTTGHETADTTTDRAADTTTSHETADTTTGHETADTTTGHETADTTTGHEKADKTTGHETADTTTDRAADTTTSHETADTTTGHETADKTTGHETADTTTDRAADTTTGHETADTITGSTVDITPDSISHATTSTSNDTTSSTNEHPTNATTDAMISTANDSATTETATVTDPKTYDISTIGTKTDHAKTDITTDQSRTSTKTKDTKTYTSKTGTTTYTSAIGTSTDHESKTGVKTTYTSTNGIPTDHATTSTKTKQTAFTSTTGTAADRATSNAIEHPTDKITKHTKFDLETSHKRTTDTPITDGTTIYHDNAIFVTSPGQKTASTVTNAYIIPDTQTTGYKTLTSVTTDDTRSSATISVNGNKLYVTGISSYIDKTSTTAAIIDDTTTNKMTIHSDIKTMDKTTIQDDITASKTPDNKDKGSTTPVTIGEKTSSERHIAALTAGVFQTVSVPENQGNKYSTSESVERTSTSLSKTMTSSQKTMTSSPKTVTSLHKTMMSSPKTDVTSQMSMMSSPKTMMSSIKPKTTIKVATIESASRLNKQIFITSVVTGVGLFTIGIVLILVIAIKRLSKISVEQRHDEVEMQLSVCKLNRRYPSAC